jgi:hypothetical protein
MKKKAPELVGSLGVFFSGAREASPATPTTGDVMVVSTVPRNRAKIDPTGAAWSVTVL